MKGWLQRPNYNQEEVTGSSGGNAADNLLNKFEDKVPLPGFDKKCILVFLDGRLLGEKQPVGECHFID